MTINLKTLFYSVLGIIVVWGALILFSTSSDSTVQGVSAVSVEDFTLEQLDGDEINLYEELEDKPVILDFFASWCPNCERSMPVTSEVYNELKDNVEIFAVNLREDEDTARDFIEKFNITYPILLDKTGSIGIKYDVAYTNYHVLINKDGTLFDTVLGDLSRDDVVRLIDNN